MIRAASALAVPIDRLVNALVEREVPRERALAAVAVRVAEVCAPAMDRSLGGPLLDGTVAPASLDVDLAPAVCQPELLGDVLEQLHDRDARRRQGAFFTPHATAARLVERATAGWSWPAHPRACDPACGGGAFLLAVAAALEARGLPRQAIVGELLWGIDADPLAVVTTHAALAIWSAAGGGPTAAPHLSARDALVSGLEAFAPPAAPFDLVVGNPPFQSQLAARTARTRDQARVLEARFGSVTRAYADASTLFMVAGASMTRAGGRCALILPESFLAARDAAPARADLLARGRIVGLWMPLEQLFTASVRVCVPVLEVTSGVGAAPSNGTIARWVGPEADGAPPHRSPEGLGSDTWAELAADLIGVPEVELVGSPTLGSIAEATAGFRDQFYGLAPFVRERAAGDPSDTVRLVTSGTIDLVNDLSARRSTTFARRTFTDPVVDLPALGQDAPELERWGRRVLVPKVLVATQTRIVEVVVDEQGTLWPSVPVIAVMAEPDRLWRVAAVLASPPVAALSLRRLAGAALTRDAIKLSAKQVLELPLPTDAAAWDLGAEHLHLASCAATAGEGDRWRRELVAFGQAMCRAYGAHDEVLTWWLDRLPSYR